VTLDVAQLGAQLRDSGVRFYGTLQLPPGKYALKSLVRVSETDRKGFQRVDLEVPADAVRTDGSSGASRSASSKSAFASFLSSSRILAVPR
jgi:hypothetical protein